jgi:predicted lysophospholipase L1 biosynthesis ABC-type transport system permease subunit
VKKGVVPRPDSMVARSLRISRPTFYMVAAFSAAVAANVMIPLQVLSSVGQATVLGFTVLFVGIVGAAVAIDILSRSNQGLATLRTLGAKREAVAFSMVSSLVAFGAAGSALGAALGAGLVAALMRSGPLVLSYTLVNALIVLGLSAAAIGLGVYVGVRASWHN